MKGEKFKVGILEEVEKLMRPVAAWRKAEGITWVGGIQEKLGSTGCLMRT